MNKGTSRISTRHEHETINSFRKFRMSPFFGKTGTFRFSARLDLPCSKIRKAEDRDVPFRLPTFFFALAILLVVVPGCRREPVKEEPKPKATTPAPAAPEDEFKRHLRLGMEQLRLFLPDSAEAEFSKCAAMKPQDPDLLFQQARVRLMGRGGKPDSAGAIELLYKAIAANPDSVRAHRLLLELQAGAGNQDSAMAEKEEVERLYGLLGQMEIQILLGYLRTGMEQAVELPEPSPNSPGIADFKAFVDASGRLQRQGRYDPNQAVPAIEKILEKYPDLALVRLGYTKMLVYYQLRVNYTNGADLPLMSSKLILDMAQSHLERIFDQLDPNSPAALQALYSLSNVAQKMADYDRTITLSDIILERPKISEELRRQVLFQKGLALYRQKKNAEAIASLEQSLTGDKRPYETQLPRLWLLHLVYESAGTPKEKRKQDFVLRKDLLLDPSKTPFAFEDIAPRLHLNKLNGLGSAAWGDFDHDGDFDVLISGHETYLVLMRNDGDVFTDVTRQAGLFNAQSGYTSTFVDYDNDGWPDIYIARDGWNGQAPNSLYLNNHNGTFTDVTAKAGLDDPSDTYDQVWADFDRDGYLDVLDGNGITGSGLTNRLFHNNGNGTFTDITQKAGVQEPRGTNLGTIGLAVADYDRDGWPDIFVAGYNAPNRLYHNKGNGTFEEVAKKAGMDGADSIAPAYTSLFIDYNTDGYPDILRVTLAPMEQTLLGLSDHFTSLARADRKRLLVNCTKLYRNNRNGTFTDVTEQAGFGQPFGSMAVNAADLDNDGFIDIYFGTGDPIIEHLEPNRFMHNNGDGTFSDWTFATGLGNLGKGHAITFVDLVGNGNLDIFAEVGGFVHGDLWPDALYRNKQTSGNHWLEVDIEGVKSNRDAVGAQLQVTAGKLTVYREKQMGVGFGSSDAPTIHFGIGKNTRIDQLKIMWPSGLTQSFGDVPIDTRVTIREGESWRKRSRQ